MKAAGRTIALVAILVLPVWAVSNPRITVGPVTGRFFANPSQAGGFTATPANALVFTQQFAAINFNPPQEAVHCTNAIQVNEWQRPMSDVVVRPDASCSVEVAQGNGKQAGVEDLEQFNAVFTGTFTVAAPGKVTFNIYADDGWILGIGRRRGPQPLFVSGPRENAPAETPFSHLPVMGAYNVATAPVRQDLVVNFPAAGTSDFELDYSECCGSQLALTLTADALAIAATNELPFGPVGDLFVIMLFIPIVKKWLDRNDLRRASETRRRGLAVRVSGEIRGGQQIIYRVDVRGGSDRNPRRGLWDE
jgi:hypothetical protein